MLNLKKYQKDTLDFAYVFCSVANVRSMTSVEQFLGRVLRMPNAKRKQQEELNKAYAHVFLHAGDWNLLD